MFFFSYFKKNRAFKKRITEKKAKYQSKFVNAKNDKKQKYL
jgi:hypothetical protein